MYGGVGTPAGDHDKAYSILKGLTRHDVARLDATLEAGLQRGRRTLDLGQLTALTVVDFSSYQLTACQRASDSSRHCSV